MKNAPITDLLRQQDEPFIVPEGASIGVYQITDEGEFQNTIKIKNVHDVAKALRGLRDDGAWLLYALPPGRKATVIAMSQKMADALT